MCVIRRRVRLVGHVQGVGLRGTLSKYCIKRHVTGWMCNTPDPTVVYAELQGAERSIEAVLRSVTSFFADPSRSRGVSIEVIGDVTVVPDDQEMHEIAWENMSQLV